MRKLKIENLKSKIEKLLPGLKKNVILAPYTTFKIGGRAKHFFVAKKKEDILLAMSTVKKHNLPVFILGKGGNTLVSDKGYKGLVIKIQNSRLRLSGFGGQAKLKTIHAEAGTLLVQLVNVALKNNLTGFEWAVGIPGTIGGAVEGNAGAFGESIGQVVQSVEVFDARRKKIKILKRKDCKFSYRNSIFRKNRNLVILSAKLKLKKGRKDKIREKMKKNLEYRRITQPTLPSAGSIFKNFTPYRPALYTKLTEVKKQIISLEGGADAGPELSKIIDKFRKTGIIPAAYLIEECGLKGKKIGKAQISKKHANFIVNLGGASAEDVKKLIKLIKQRVKNIFKIDLEEEIQYLNQFF